MLVLANRGRNLVVNNAGARFKILLLRPAPEGLAGAGRTTTHPPELSSLASSCSVRGGPGDGGSVPPVRRNVQRNRGIPGTLPAPYNVIEEGLVTSKGKAYWVEQGGNMQVLMVGRLETLLTVNGYLQPISGTDLLAFFSNNLFLRWMVE